jgi:hypothetical protein
MALTTEGRSHEECVAYTADKQGDVVIHQVTFATSVERAHAVLAEMLTAWAVAFDQPHVLESIREAAGQPAAAAPVDRSKMN